MVYAKFMRITEQNWQKLAYPLSRDSTVQLLPHENLYHTRKLYKLRYIDIIHVQVTACSEENSRNSSLEL